MKKIFAYIIIVRPVNFAITFASIFAAGFIADQSLVLIKQIIFASISGALIASGGNVINDYFDIEIDKINRPQRVMVKGLISKLEALIFYVVLNIGALVLSAFINLPAFLIAIAAFIFILSYSYKFKGVPLAGNFIVSLFTGLAFIYGAVAAGNWLAGFMPAVFAFLINFIREIVKDIEDLKGDSAKEIFTFPAKFGIKKSNNLILVLTIMLIAVTFVPFIFRFYNIEYFVIVMSLVNTLLVLFIRDLYSDKRNYAKLSSLLKTVMIFGLAAIVLGNL